MNRAPFRDEVLNHFFHSLSVEFKLQIQCTMGLLICQALKEGDSLWSVGTKKVRVEPNLGKFEADDNRVRSAND